MKRMMFAQALAALALAISLTGPAAASLTGRADHEPPADVGADAARASRDNIALAHAQVAGDEAVTSNRRHAAKPTHPTHANAHAPQRANRPERLHMARPAPWTAYAMSDLPALHCRRGR